MNNTPGFKNANHLRDHITISIDTRPNKYKLKPRYFRNSRLQRTRTKLECVDAIYSDLILFRY